MDFPRWGTLSPLEGSHIAARKKWAQVHAWNRGGASSSAPQPRPLPAHTPRRLRGGAWSRRDRRHCLRESCIAIISPGSRTGLPLSSCPRGSGDGLGLCCPAPSGGWSRGPPRAGRGVRTHGVRGGQLSGGPPRGTARRGRCPGPRPAPRRPAPGAGGSCPFPVWPPAVFDPRPLRFESSQAMPRPRQ